RSCAMAIDSLAAAVPLAAMLIGGKRGHGFRNQIEKEKVCNKAGQKAHRLAHMDMVVLDELNHLPFSSSGGALPFNLLRKLYTFTTLFVENNRLSRLSRLQRR
ncbi:hypothetical protein DBR42_04655, partial [Pelomonas sp. HMWF004]